MFPFDYPKWAVKARLGRAQIIRMNVFHDEDVDVYLATTADMPGLICEADTREELKAETERVFRDVVTFFTQGKPAKWPVLEWE